MKQPRKYKNNLTKHEIRIREDFDGMKMDPYDYATLYGNDAAKLCESSINAICECYKEYISMLKFND